MRLNPKKTKSMVVSRSGTSVPGYGDLTLGGAVLEEIKRLRILRMTIDFKLTFETNMRQVVSKPARSLGVVRGSGKLFDCPRVLKSCFNAYVLSSLASCTLVCKSSTEFYLSLLDKLVRRAENLCEGEHCCLGYRRKVSALCFLYKIYHRVDYPPYELVSESFSCS